MGPWEGRTVLRTGRRAKDPIYQSDSQLKSRSAKSAKTKFFAPKCHYLRGDFFNNTTQRIKFIFIHATLFQCNKVYETLAFAGTIVGGAAEKCIRLSRWLCNST